MRESYGLLVQGVLKRKRNFLIEQLKHTWNNSDWSLFSGFDSGIERCTKLFGYTIFSNLQAKLCCESI